MYEDTGLEDVHHAIKKMQNKVSFMYEAPEHIFS